MMASSQGPVSVATPLTASPATLISSSAPIVTTFSTSPRHPESYPPMTTKWSTPDSCTWTFDIAQEPVLGTPGPIAWLDLEPQPDASTLSCYPDGMFYDGRTGTFSPATCPNGWTTVSVRQDDNTPQTTTAVCCSSEYSLDGTICKRELPTVLAVPIIYNTSGTTYEVLTSETSTLVSATLAVYTIQALFRERDKEILGLTDESSIREEPPEPTGMSLGTRIGIGIGATIGGLIVMGAALWLLFCHRKSSSEKSRSCRRWPGDRQSPEIVSVGPPPPAYEFSVRGSVTDDDADDSSATRDGEIEILRAQKAAIQRRIDELETVETSDDTTRHP